MKRNLKSFSAIIGALAMLFMSVITVFAETEEIMPIDISANTIITDKNFDVTDSSAFNISAGDAVMKNIAVKMKSASYTQDKLPEEAVIIPAISAKGGNVFIQSSGISTSCAFSAGISAEGNAKIYLENSDVTAQATSSNGVISKNGALFYAWNSTFNAKDSDSFIFKITENAGKTVLDGCKLTTEQPESHAVYTENLFVANESSVSGIYPDIIGIAGGKVNLYNTSLDGSLVGEANENYIVSLSNKLNGTGTSEFYMDGGKLTAYNTGIFSLYGNDNKIHISNTEIVSGDDCPYLLMFNQTGEKTACNLTVNASEIKDNVVMAEDNTLDFYLLDASKFSGRFLDKIAVNEEKATEQETEITKEADAEEVKEESKTEEAEKTNARFYNVNMFIGFDSVWTVNESVKINKLVNCNAIVDSEGNPVKVIDKNGKVLEEGESEITVTVNEYTKGGEAEKFEGSLFGEEYGIYKLAKPEKLNYEPATETTTREKIPEEVKETLFKYKNYVAIAGGVLVALIITVIIVKSNKKKK